MEQNIQPIPEREEFAKDFLKRLSATVDGATVVGLSGELGSGKTAFVKAAANALNISEAVLSPTFVIAKFYKIPEHTMWSRLVHLDAYRIADPVELSALRWKSIVDDPRNLVFVEWPENIEKSFPCDAQTLAFRFIDEGTRSVSSSLLIPTH